MKLLQTKHMKFYFLLLLVLSVIACQNADSGNEGQDLDTTELSENEVKSDSVVNETEPEAPPENKYQLPDWPIKAKDEKGKVYPYDEGKKDTSFVAFRQRLYQATIEKDLDFLLSITSDNIKYSFGDADGKEGFLMSTGLKDDPVNSMIWKELALCLELGGGFFDNPDYFAFYAPFVREYCHN